MRIALVSSSAPFIDGGARNIVTWLGSHLVEAGHEVEEIFIPFNDNPNSLFPQLAAFRLIDLTDKADLVVCFRPPAHLIRHPRKVLWFIHHLRVYYDLWESEYRPLPDTLPSRALRADLFNADTQAMLESTQVFTNSQVVSERIRKFNGVESSVLYPPLHDPERFSSGRYGDEIVYVSRLEPHKRQHLLVEALQHTESNVRVRLVGTGSPDYVEKIRKLALELGVSDRVSLTDSWVSEDEKATIISTALAVAYLPVDEDSYGYPTLEAAYSRRPVITTTDSGGVLEFVQHEVNGLIVEPSAKNLARAFDQLEQNRTLVAELGEGAYRRVDELGISWETVISRLVE